MKNEFDGLVDHLLTGGISLQEAIEILTKNMIQGALERSNRNQSAASKALGIHRNTLQRKMREYELCPRRKPIASHGLRTRKSRVA